MNKYTYDQVRTAAVAYFKGDELAAEVFAGKYALQDLVGNLYELTPEDMHRRLAKEFARIELKYPNPMSEGEIFDLFKDWTVVPQGSPMSGIGNPFQVQSISNCFVIDPAEDSYAGIFRADQEQAQIMKRRGGVGHDLSKIRPKGLPAANAARTTDGIGVFMDRFSNTTREVAQNGRRGALMLSISIHHPEVETFINIKKDRKRVTGANISVRVTDEFMTALRAGKEYEQRWPVDSANPTIIQKVDARKIWNTMMEAAWDSAEPGILFWDSIIRGSPADCYADVGYRTISTNPCGELPLPPYDSCRLLLLNLLKFVKNPYTEDAVIDYERFEVVAYKAQRLMDDLIDLELEMIDKILAKIDNDPENETVKRVEKELWLKIKGVTLNGRRTGLGITALGDMLAALNVKYGSEDSEIITEDVYAMLARESYRSSIDMAEERGAFGVFDYNKEKGHEFLEKVIGALGGKYKKKWAACGRRNIANLTTSPAGSVSIETQTTSGGECAFLVAYGRRRKINPGDKQSRVDFVDDSGDQWQEYKVYHHGHTEWARINGKDPDRDIKESPYYGSTSADINWIDKVKLQAAAQRWVDHSISNTTNVPKNTTVEQVSEIYMEGWLKGCKGITIYREGSRSGVLIAEDDNSKTGRSGDSIKESSAPQRPETLKCDIHHAKIKGVQHLIIVGLMKGKPYEIFLGEASKLPELSKSGEVSKVKTKSGTHYSLKVNEEVVCKDIVGMFDDPNHGAFTRTISTALRHGVPVMYLVEQLRKDKHSDMFSFASVVARIFSKNYIADGTKSSEKVCQDCNSKNLAYLQGCVTCMDCGSGKCS